MKGRKTFILNGRAIWRIAFIFPIIMILFCLQTPLCAENIVQRDIMEFVEAQGTPVGFSPYDYVGWAAPEDPPVLVALVDYAGVTNDVLDLDLGTRFSGVVTERPLSDGRAKVVVNLYTRRALVWVTDVGEELDPDEFNCTQCPLVFGARGEDVLGGARPAFANSLLQLMFINNAPGDPLPDLFSTFVTGDTYNGQELISVSFHAKCIGLLADGSPGMAMIDQIGRFVTPGKGVALEDSFPVENIEVKPVGRGRMRRSR